MTTPSDLMTRELRRDGTRPFITWYGAAAGERVELSVTTTANWVAKIAGYVSDELDVYSDDPILIDPTLHWVTAVAMLAVWQTGAQLAVDPAESGERLALPLDPMGMGLSALVASYPDVYPATQPSAGDLVSAASGFVPDAARVLTVLPLDGAGMAWGLLGPLIAGGSVLYCPADAAGLADRATAERVTHTVGVDVPGLPRLG